MDERIELRFAVVNGALCTEFKCPKCSQWSPAKLTPDDLGMVCKPEPGVDVYELRCIHLCDFRLVFSVKRSTLVEGTA